VAPSKNQSVFTTLTNLLQVLRTPAPGPAGQAALTNGLTPPARLATAKDNIMTVDAQVGSSQKELGLPRRHRRFHDRAVRHHAIELQDLDTVSAISLFTQQQTTLQAAPESFTQISGLRCSITYNKTAGRFRAAAWAERCRRRRRGFFARPAARQRTAGFDALQ